MSCCGNRGSGGAGGRCTCKVVAGDGATVTGRGSSRDPYVISAKGGGEGFSCEDARGCFSAKGPAEYDPATGEFGVMISDGEGNQVREGEDGGLFVPAGSSAGEVDAPDWPHTDCPSDEIGQPVYKDEAGKLVTDTAVDTRYSFHKQEQKPGPTRIPAGVLELKPATIELENPDKCRSARLIIEVQADIDITLPPGASAHAKLGGEEMLSLGNGGTEEVGDQHVQLSKNYYNYVLKPGQKWTFTCPQEIGGGRGGATYNRHQWYVKALMLIGTRRNDEVK